MSTLPENTLKVNGELKIIPNNTGKLSQGKLTFTTDYEDPYTPYYAQIRAIGDPLPNQLMLDTSYMTDGLVVRTNWLQGYPSIAGPEAKNNPYSLIVNEDEVIVPTQLNVTQPSKYYGINKISGNEKGEPCFYASRNGTADTTLKHTYISKFYQNVMKVGERFSMALDSNATNGTVLFGLSYPLLESVDGFGFVGMDYGIDDVREAMIWDMTGNCTSQKNHTVVGTLSANTVSATNYIGLPSFDPLPLTLDKVNSRVGINKVSPLEALDVTGNINATGNITGQDLRALHHVDVLGDITCSGTMTANTVSATTYIGLPTTPAFDPLPITLDKVNNRVGINDTTPSYSLDITGTFRNTGNAFVGTDLDVTGNAIIHGDVDVTGHIVTTDHINGGVITGTSLVGALATASQPNITSVGTLSNLSVTGDVTIDSSTLKVDSANNRVGIVQATPTQPLDVTGNIKTTGDVMLGSTLLTTGSGSPEGIKTAPVGSIYTRTDGSSGTAMYVKESGSGNTGWTAISVTPTPPSGTTYTLGADSSVDLSTGNTSYTVWTIANINPGVYKISDFYVNLYVTARPGTTVNGSFAGVFPVLLRDISSVANNTTGSPLNTLYTCVLDTPEILISTQLTPRTLTLTLRSSLNNGWLASQYKVKAGSTITITQIS